MLCTLPPSIPLPRESPQGDRSTGTRLAEQGLPVSPFTVRLLGQSLTAPPVLAYPSIRTARGAGRFVQSADGLICCALSGRAVRPAAAVPFRPATVRERTTQTAAVGREPPVVRYSYGDRSCW